MVAIENLFVTLFTISVSTAIVLVPLILLSPLAKRRYPAKWLCLLWLIIAVRLLAPFNLTLPDAPVQIPLPIEVTQPITGAPILPAVGQELTAIPNGDSLPGAVAATSLSLLQLATLLWLVGMAAYLILQAVLYGWFVRRVQRFARTASPQTQDILHLLASEMNLKRYPAILVSPLVQTPVLVGIFKPILYLPQREYSHDEKRLILRHELVHYRRHDVLYKFIFLLVCAVHWYNPAVWLLSRQAAKDIEIACDDVIVNGLDNGQRALYGQVILDGIIRKRSMVSVLSTQLGGSKRTIKQRLKNLFDFKAKRRGALALCAVVLSIGLTGSFVACAPQQQGSSTPPDSQSFVSASSNDPSPSYPVSSTSIPITQVEMETMEYDGKTWYVIENEAQLRSIAFDDETLSRNYIQHGDIALADAWTPIGNGDHPFTGTYTGDGYHISGLQIAGPQVNNAGLFGVVENGVVYNVTLLQPTMSPLDSRSEIRVVALAMGGSYQKQPCAYGRTARFQRRRACRDMGYCHHSLL